MRGSQPTPDPDRTPVELSEEDALPLLQSSPIIGGRRISWGSNYTFLVWIDAGPGRFLPAVYKPRAGERPLYDFPAGSLYKREYATFIVSRGLGWPNVPLTVVRDGPHGVGSVQLYVNSDPGTTYFDLIDSRRDDLKRFAVFDLLANNADRKAGHCLLGRDGRLWSIDHGLTFHPAFKLRTVMVEFWGETIDEDMVDDIESLLDRLRTAGKLRDGLAEYLDTPDIDALERRLQAVVERPALPRLDPYRNVPWPWV